MIRKHPLVSHPVGRLAASARWYLAGIAMLALTLIAIHFAIQVYAQQEAKRLVFSWSEQSDVSVGDVRYRLLRGALTLVDLRLDRDGVHAHLPTLFLHGNLVSMAAGKPQTNYIEIRGASLSLTGDALSRIAAGESEIVPALVHQIWNSAQRVGVYRSNIGLLPDDLSSFPSRPTTITLARLEGRGEAETRVVEALAQGLGGELELAMQTVPEKSAHQFNGTLSWRGVSAALFLKRLLNLSPVQAQLNGSVTWRWSSDVPAAYALAGNAALHHWADGGEDAEVHWDGSVSRGAWQGSVDASAWPLAMFAEQLPEFQKQRLVAGRFDGAFKLEAGFGRWQMEMAEANMRDLRYREHADAAATMAAEQLPEWRLGAMQLSSARLEWPERRIKAEAMTLSNASFVIDARAAEKKGAFAGAWNIAVQEILLNQISPAVRLSEDLFHLPSLEGKASWQGDGRLQLKLQSTDIDQIDSTEGWVIYGDGYPASKSGSRFNFDVAAQKATLVRFRPFLPAMLRRGATEMAGEVALELHLSAGGSGWEGSGRAKASDARLLYLGEQWRAKTAAVELGAIGVHLQEQEIPKLELQEWYYQAALRPLSQPKADKVAAESEEQAKAEAWHIGELLLNGGRIAVGHADALWMQEADIRVTDFRPGIEAPVTVRAKLGDGAFAVDGKLLWNSSTPELRQAKLSVRDALPFFIHEWLEISDLPQLFCGRLYADVSFEKDAEALCKGLGFIRLQHGRLGPAVAGNDWLLTKVGFNTHDVFSALQEGGSLRLNVPFQGSNCSVALFEQGLIAALKRRMGEKKNSVRHGASPAGVLLSSIRLHGDGTLSHNERVRLRKIALQLRKDPKKSIELKPQLSLSTQDEKQLERARYTQGLIENYLIYRGVARSRIFPVWPNEQHRSSGSSNGIKIVTVP